MHEWLMGLTRPEDSLLWSWLAIVVGYAIVGIALGYRARTGQNERQPGPTSAPSSR